MAKKKSVIKFPQAERLAAEDAVLDFGQFHRERGQIHLADDVLEFAHIHPCILHTAQGDVQLEIGLYFTALGLEISPDVLNQRQKVGGGIGGREMDNLAVIARGKGVKLVKGEGRGDRIIEDVVQPGHQIDIIGRKIQEGHRDMIVSPLPTDIDAIEQVAQLPEPIIVKGDRHFDFKITLHRGQCMLLSANGMHFFLKLKQYNNAVWLPEEYGLLKQIIVSFYQTGLNVCLYLTLTASIDRQTVPRSGANLV